MLIGIDPLLSGELLHVLREMGHGDRIVVTDCNFPSFKLGPPAIRMDTDIVQAGRAILSVFPLDSFVEQPLLRMEVIGRPDELVDAHVEFQAMVREVAGPRWAMGSLERFAFYEAARSCCAIVATLDRRGYANIILTKGVIAPDGTVR
jgi:L-fucose mutarotase